MYAVAEAIFWISFSLVFYTYIGYPLILFLLVGIKKLLKKNHVATFNSELQAVTLIICAYNEEEIIEEKIINTLAIDYPPSLLKVVFITDGSTDNTPGIIKKHSRFQLLHEEERKGKIAAMNRAMKFTETDVVIFSDANGFLNHDSIKNMLKHYSDKKTGAVTGEKKIIDNRSDTVSKGEGLYWKYESVLKNLDGQLKTVVGAAGELFSIRTKLYTPLDDNIIIEDFVQSLLVCSKGYVVKYEPGAFSEEAASCSIRDEMERKIRITAGGFQAISVLKSLFNPFRYSVIFFQLVSHRILRWTLCPLALIFLFFSSLALFWQNGSDFYTWVILLQVLFYLAGLAGWLYALNNHRHKVFYLPFYFIFMNFCVFAGFFRYLTHNQEAIWKKADRARKI